MCLVWSNSVGGTNSCDIYKHHVNVVFLMQWVISKSLGLWRGDDPAECTVVIHISWVTSDVLGLVEFRRGDE